MRSVLLSGIVALCLTTTAHAVGPVNNPNFSVFVPTDNAFADEVLERAEAYRDEIALEWFGAKLPPSVGRTIINVQFDEEEFGLTWAIDRPKRKFHAVALWVASEEEALGGVLKHEIAHTVMATQYPHPARLPVWTEEGIASRYDDDARKAVRTGIVRWWRQTGNWPALSGIITTRNVVSHDEASYAMAASLTDFLLSRGDKATMIRFARAGQRDGWDAALLTHYKIDSVARLQTAWELWVSQSNLIASRTVGAVSDH